MLTGIGASGGIGIGKVLIYREPDIRYADRAVSDTAAEKTRFAEAHKRFCADTERKAQSMAGTAAEEILRGHIAMISDPFMRSQIDERIDGGACAEKALEEVCDMFIAIFSGADDELTRQRAADVEDIKRHILQILIGIEEVDLGSLPADTVLAVSELTPSMTAALDIKNICGIVTEKGGKTSHSAIISRALRIPSVLSVENALATLTDGCEVIVDGSAGEVYTEVDDALREKYRALQKQYAEREALTARYRGKATATADGISKELFANIGTHKDLESVLEADAEGIGLFRTEFLFMDRSAAPTEDEQFEAYKSVAVGMQGKEVIIRTLDVGGDKEIPYLGLKKEENPFLGFRAVRYCLKHRESYKTQLRAVLRASAFGNLSVMIPLVTCVEELREVKTLIDKIKCELDGCGIPYKRDIKVGVMIETPAACMIADLLAKEADFFSIGTNDLIGYTMAADRGNADVGYLYTVYQPAVLRALKHIISCASAAKIRCGMCGEAAADEKLLPLLVSFGLDEFSVSPVSVLGVRAALAARTKADCDRIAEKALALTTAKEVEDYLKNPEI